MGRQWLFTILSLSLAILVAGNNTRWQPCKKQCENSFAYDEALMKTGFVLNCQKGCDLYTMALIFAPKKTNSIPTISENPDIVVKDSETSKTSKNALTSETSETKKSETNIKKHPVSDDKKIAKPTDGKKKEEKRAVSFEQPPPFVMGFRSSFHEDISFDKTMKKIHNENNPMKVEIMPKDDTIIVIKEDQFKDKSTSEKSHLLHILNSSNNDIRKVLEVIYQSSKTTAQPTPHPVQDHPMTANRQATTNVPRESGKTVSPVKDKSVKVTTKKPQSPNDIQVIKSEEFKPLQISDLDDVHSRVEQAKHSCRHACIKTFAEGMQPEACVVGCHLQAATVSLMKKPHETRQSFLQLKTPLAMIQHIMFGLAGQVGRLVRVSWSWSSSSNPEEHVEKLPEVPSNTIPMFENKEDLSNWRKVPLFGFINQNTLVDKTDKPVVLDKPTQHSENSLLSYNDQKMGLLMRLKMRVKDILDHRFHRKHEENKHQEHQKQKQHNSPDNHQNPPALDLLECISRKSGLPRWFIAIAIFASALVVLWLCFSLTGPPEEIKVHKVKPPVYDGDDDEDEDADFDDDLSCSEKKKLLSRTDDVIKIRIENV